MTSRPLLRWLVPAVATVAVIGGGAAIGTLAADAEPTLPERSAAQLLVDLQTARLESISGTVLQQSDLGLPAIAGLAASAGAGQGGTDLGALATLATGSNTLRVWYSGPDKARLAVLGTLGETDVIRNGKDVWVWNSRENAASHTVLTGDGPDGKPEPLPSGLPTGLPSTPQQAADAALKAVDPSTKVSVGRAARVAGRDAYELVLAPRDTNSLVGQLRLAIDAKAHVPLRVEVFAKGVQEPAVRVAFTQVDFARPDDRQFTFNPPPGAKVTERSASEGTDARDKAGKALAEKRAAAQKAAGKPGAADRADGPTVVGTGWTSVLVQKVGTAADLADLQKEAGKTPATKSPAAKNPAEGAADQVGALLDQLPKVSGTWGSGRQLTSKLFTVLLTDDGRLLAGAVTPQRLYEIAGTSAGK